MPGSYPAVRSVGHLLAGDAVQGERTRLPGVLPVLLIDDVHAPVRAVARLVDLEHREVGHEAVGRSTVPVLLAGLEENAVARANRLDWPAAPLVEARPLGDEDV